MNDTGIQKNQQIIWTQEKTSALFLTYQQAFIIFVCTLM